MKKIYLAVLVVILMSFNTLRATNVVIITSTPYSMEVDWDTACSQLGFTAGIFAQTMLDSTYWYGTTDILIVSNGVIAYTQQEFSNIQGYLAQGGKVYLQTEYDCANFTSNQGFEQIVDSLPVYPAIATRILNPLWNTEASISVLYFVFPGATVG
jgi:hypothetical protein